MNKCWLFVSAECLIQINMSESVSVCETSVHLRRKKQTTKNHMYQYVLNRNLLGLGSFLAFIWTGVEIYFSWNGDEYALRIAVCGITHCEDVHV